MKVAILAGGFGTRISEESDVRPKPMIEIGKERILEKILDSIKKTGITEFVVVTGYHANLIEEHFGDGRSFGMQITYVRQKELDGTAGALRITKDNIKDDPFLLTFGDIITNPINHARIQELWKNTNADALLSVNEIDDPYKGAAVIFDEATKQVTKIIERKTNGN